MFAGLHLPPPEPLGDAALERTRLFEAVSRLMERVAAERPMALLVDDLHWADEASLELLHYLARRLEGRRVLLLGTYRLDEARTQPGLRTLVRSLQRLGLAEEIHVGGLGPEAVAALARALLGGEPPAELLGVLRERAAGTPLFVTALIRGLRDTGELFHSGGAWVLGSGSLTAVPPVVRDLILARLERLDPADRALQELVAVAGDAASSAILGRVVGTAEEELDAALRRLGETGLVVEEPSETDLVYRAGHPLVAEVAYGELPEAQRRRLHAGVAAVLEALDVGDPQRLAHHYRGAAWEADPRRALDVLVAAGRRAEELHADAGAPTISRRRWRLPADRPAIVEELLERLGHARSRAGQFGAAVAAWSEAVGGRERAGDRPAAARLQGLLALAEWDRGRFEAAEAHLAAEHQQPTPRWVALYQLGLLLPTASGRVHPLAAYLGWLHDAGFQPPERHLLVDQAQAVLLVTHKLVGSRCLAKDESGTIGLDAGTLLVAEEDQTRHPGPGRGSWD